MTASVDHLAGRGAHPREVRLQKLAARDPSDLAETADHLATVAMVLGEHLADIAEMVGLDREAEDLAIPPNVKRVVDQNERRARALDAICALHRRVPLVLEARNECLTDQHDLFDGGDGHTLCATCGLDRYVCLTCRGEHGERVTHPCETLQTARRVGA